MGDRGVPEDKGRSVSGKKGNLRTLEQKKKNEKKNHGRTLILETKKKRGSWSMGKGWRVCSAFERWESASARERYVQLRQRRRR